MGSSQRPVFKRIETETGVQLTLLIDWTTDSTFNIDVWDGVKPWRGTEIRCPENPTVGVATWLQKAREAFGLAEAETPFSFGYSYLQREACELRWLWPSDDPEVRNVGRLTVEESKFDQLFDRFLASACELSDLLSLVTIENNKAQRVIKDDFLSLGQELEKATDDRKMIYKKCTAMFNEKKREIEEKDREIRALREKLDERMETEDRYSDATS